MPMIKAQSNWRVGFKNQQLDLKKWCVNFKKSQAGSGMIEILIATGVVAMVMTAIVAGFILSVKSTSLGKDKVAASTKAQEGMEVFRREKVLLGWSRFSDSVADDTYCINDLPADSATFQAMPVGACEADDVIEGTNFRRNALVDILGDKIRVEVVVSWQDGIREQTTSVIQEFQQYE